MKTSMRKTTALICALALTASPVTFSAFPAFAEEIAAVQAQSGSGEVTQEQIEKNIIGSWVLAEKDGQPALTNEKVGFRFVSPTEAYANVSRVHETTSPWRADSKREVNISGNRLTIDIEDGSKKINHQFTITDMSSDHFTANIESTLPFVTANVVTYVKVDDLSEAVLGTWEGKCTSEGSVFDDGKEHRWEYKSDGTYVYYNKDGDKWVADDSEKCEYFVVGNLLCTRWTKNGTENREWWEISVKDGKMSWTALRADEKGSTYMATFEMNKVEESASEVTQEQIEKNITGSWVLAEKDGQPALTNEKVGYRFVSPTEAYTSVSSVHETTSPWRANLKCQISISGNRLTISYDPEDGSKKISNQFTITDMSSDHFTANIESTLPFVTENVATFVKVDDLSEAVLGTWEGKSTSEGSVFDDGKEHRWEYKSDGTYVFYNKDGDKWVADDSEKCEYFVAGNLLCTRWTKDGTENREWWEISVKDGKMSWTALRADADNSTFTATFEMEQVKESAAEVTQEQIEKNIIGKWILAEKNGEPALTNEKMGYSIVSTSEGYSWLSRVKENASYWNSGLHSKINISGNVLTMTLFTEDGLTVENQLTITDINSDKLTANLKITLTGRSSEPLVTENVASFVKVDDLSEAVLGTWEGKCTSESSVFDDGKEHRWEYKSDGTYVYYNKDGDKWVADDSEKCEYFVAGNLLCTRWTKNGTENREWWEISVKDGKMSWTALRADEKGSTYTATFEMEQVKESAAEVTQEEIEEHIVGTWIRAEKNGQPLLTNDKIVYSFVSPTEAYQSASLVRADASPWHTPSKCGIEINGNTITITYSLDDLTYEQQYTITDISSDTFTANRKFTRSSQDSDPEVIEDVVTFVKVDDLSEAVLGTWEGKCTSEGSVFDDGKEHRWEYKPDGSYVYYNKEGDEWVPSDNTENEYFIAGNLLCMRWVDNGTENREWWEISVKDGKMSWNALRANEDGSTYTSTFEMQKFITPERMWEMAVKDYQKKHGNVAVTAENGKKNLDGTVEVILKDEAGNIVETYTVDARTGVGTDSKQNAVNLPQTGINGMGAVAAVGSAVLMTAAGAWMMFRSSRKKDEDV